MAVHPCAAMDRLRGDAVNKYVQKMPGASDEYATPDEIFKALDAEFHFTLDPCSTDDNAKCEKHYTMQDDGLSKSWGGDRVFCNPPYSNIGAWVEKAYRESRQDSTLIVMLIPARTDTRYFHDFIYGRSEIRFIKGRLRFNGINSNAPFPSMVVIFRGAYA